MEKNFHRHRSAILFQLRNFLFFRSNAACSNPRTFALILSRACLILEKWEIPSEAPFYGTGISVCQFSPFPPAATDCEMKFYIKLRLSSFFFPFPAFVFSLSRLLRSLIPFAPLFSPTSSTLLLAPLIYLRTDRSLCRRLHIYWHRHTFRQDA